MFKKREPGREMAFGKIPACRRCELHMERHRSPTGVARQEFAGKDSVSILDFEPEPRRSI